MTGSKRRTTAATHGMDRPLGAGMVGRGRRGTIRGALLVSVLSVTLGVGASLAQTGAGGADGLMLQAVSAIDTGDYIRATQLLTRIVGMPSNTQSARAQELLGNVREANGQLAHAKAEYEIYLDRYPEGDGAPRVRSRLDAILSGAVPALPVAPDASAPARPRVVTAPRGSLLAQGALRAPAAPGRIAAPAAPGATPTRIVRERGLLTLTYRYNETATDIEDLTPAPGPNEEEDDVLENALSAGLQYSRTVEDAKSRTKLVFSGRADLDFTDDDDGDRQRISEAYYSWEGKATGTVVTFGRQRLDPQGLAYRTDGLSVKWPAGDRVSVTFVLGSAVDSTRTDLFAFDRTLVGAAATIDNVGGGAMSVYVANESDGSRTFRSAIGAEYKLEKAGFNLYVNADYDIKFSEINRILVTGGTVLKNGGRLTGRLAYYRSPALDLDNALIGQTAGNIDALLLAFTEDEIEQLAIDRSAEVTTLGLTYYGKLNPKWDLSLDGTLFHSSGTPASGGVAATDDGNVNVFLGARLFGSSVFMPNDQVSFGGRYTHGDTSDLVIVDGSVRFPVSDKLTVQPRLQVGYRDFSTAGGGDETFAITSVNARYKINATTSFQVDAGGRFSREENATTLEKRRQFFLTAGVSKSF